MSSEKLTVESVVDTIRENTLTSDSVEFIKNFLKQIRDEEIELHSLRNESSITTYEVFDKYIK